MQNSMNSVELLPDGAEDNTEPSSYLRKWCNDYPEREYAQASGSVEQLII